MTLIKRQGVTFESFDDQSAELWGYYVGNWTHYNVQGFNNNTVTATPTPGASLSFMFTGTQAWLYGGLLNLTSSDGQITSYPGADYLIDGTSAGNQKPWFDTNGAVVYFQTPVLAGGTHMIQINVTVANATNPFIIDQFLVSPTVGASNSGVQTSRTTPSPTVPIHITEHTTPVGAIVGGVVGGVGGIALLLLAAWFFFFRKKRGGQAYYFDKPRTEDMLAAEDHHVEPFGTAPTTPGPSSPGFNGPGRLSAYSDSSNQPLNPRNTLISSPPSHYSQSGPSESGVTYVSGNSTQPRTGKHALIAQQHQNVQPAVQLEDSGMRFNEGEQEPGPSQLPSEVPPSYTPH
jgi:hypothetical protein